MTKRSSVVNIQSWKKRPLQQYTGTAVEVKAPKEDVRLLSRTQKQATLLRLVLSDDIDESDLDAIVEAALSLVSKRGS